MLARQRDPAHKGRVRELVADAQQAANQLGMVRLKLQIADLIKEL
jgi:Mg-chelatase subunit ChlD